MISDDMTCVKCNRSFKSPKCFRNHRKSRGIRDYTVCQQYSLCPTCFKFVDILKQKITKDGRKDKPHKCDEKYCFYCYEYVSIDHQCNIKPYKMKMPKTFIIIFYDIETVQTHKIFNLKTKGIDSLHQPILVCGYQVCNLCWEIDDEKYECKRCYKRKLIFEGSKCVKEFIQYVIRYKKDVAKICCVGHNARSFDNHFLINEIFNIPNNEIKLIMNGYKILKITVKKYILFVDSILFLPMSLSKFEKAPKIFIRAPYAIKLIHTRNIRIIKMTHWMIIVGFMLDRS